MLLKSLWFSILFLWGFECFSQEYNAVSDIDISLEKDTLIIGNGKVQFTYLWNNGNLGLLKIQDNESSKVLNFKSAPPEFYLLNESEDIIKPSMVIKENLELGYKEAIVEFVIGSLEVRRLIRIYTETKMVKNIFYLRGTGNASWETEAYETQEMIESISPTEENISKIASFNFFTEHWKFKAVKFREATDYHDNPVEVEEFLSFGKRNKVSANLLIGSNPEINLSLLLLKEAPISWSQQSYPGFDFLVDYKGISVHGLGIAPSDLGKNWTQGYGYAIGISENNSDKEKITLLGYQKKIRPYVQNRDFMIMSNTWGDRSKDSRMNEAFILSEIEAASNLGVTHIQLDDGWQQGLSRNSADKAGLKWDDWQTSDWLPHQKRFPNGLVQISKEAKKKNLKLGLWFNPSKNNSYANWERDAAILVNYHWQYGINTFKIDGMDLANKTSEINLRNLFSKVISDSQGEVTFNLDVTAGERMGYHFFNEYGNIFLENRYTDWGNYYPYRTLKNLWELSSYVPAERFQIEFLNTSRNLEKYANKNFMPNAVGLSYAFAITMVAQPLAWMELSGLQEIPQDIIDLIAQYKEIQERLHAGVILPIGKKPDGRSWTGFLSIGEKKEHYLLLFREYNKENRFTLELPFTVSEIVYILGNPPGIIKNTSQEIIVELTHPWSFSMLKIQTP